MEGIRPLLASRVVWASGPASLSRALKSALPWLLVSVIIPTLTRLAVGWEEGPVSLERVWELLCPQPRDPGRGGLVLDPQNQGQLAGCQPRGRALPWRSKWSS